MRRVLLAVVAVCLGLHWRQAWERCRRADLRSQSARQELSALEESLKDWPQLRRLAERLPPPKKYQPQQMKHQAGLQISFTPLEEEQVYRMRLAGPRPAVVAELAELSAVFCLRAVDLKGGTDGQMRGEVVLQGVP